MSLAKFLLHNTSVPFMLRRMSTKPKQILKLTIENDGICILTMNRPPVNSLNLELLQDISKNLDEVEKSGCRGMILTSEVPSIFSAGLDFNELLKPDERRLREFWCTLKEVLIKLFGSKFITAAAINGHSPAGGCSLALACEYRVMVPEKVIGLNEVEFGIMVPDWLVEFMRYTIGSRNTELATTNAKMFTTKEALEFGLIDDLAADKDDAVDKCKKFIKVFDNIPLFARTGTKMVLRNPILKFMTNKDNNKRDIDNFVSCVMSKETQILIESYVKKLKIKK